MKKNIIPPVQFNTKGIKSCLSVGWSIFARLNTEQFRLMMLNMKGTSV